MSAGNAGFAADTSGRGDSRAGAARGTARADSAGRSAARAGCGAAAGFCAAAGFPGAGGHGTGGKAVDNDTDSSDRLGGRQCAARTMVAGHMAGFCDSAAQEQTLSQQARRNAYLCVQRGQIAVSGRAGSGGVSDGGCAANEFDGIDFTP